MTRTTEVSAARTMDSPKAYRNIAAGMLIALLSSVTLALEPQTVSFASDDNKTQLTAYLYTPTGAGPFPAIVALHGRTGLYSTRGNRLDASFLAPHKRMWGEFWSGRGYLLLFVDSFGPRGHARGFAAGTFNRRPPEVNEITIRPLDAYAALQYLRTRDDVLGDQIFVQGWSNGGSATLSAMSSAAASRNPRGFRAAIAIYPACTQVIEHYGKSYKTYASVLLLIGSRDQEVKPENCARVAELARSNGSQFEFVLYADAEHSYDTPIASRQRVAANASALEDTRRRSEAFFALHRR